jgi:hypothetical protein
MYSMCRVITKGLAWTAQALTPHLQHYWREQSPGVGKIKSRSSSPALPSLVYCWARCMTQVVLGFLVVQTMTASGGSEQDYGRLLEQGTKALVDLVDRMDLDIIKHTVSSHSKEVSLQAYCMKKTVVRNHVMTANRALSFMHPSYIRLCCAHTRHLNVLCVDHFM